MNRRRKLLIPLLFCGAMLTACDDKSAENAAAMTPEVGVVTLSPGSVNVLSELPVEPFLMKLPRYVPRWAVLSLNATLSKAIK